MLARRSTQRPVESTGVVYDGRVADSRIELTAIA